MGQLADATDPTLSKGLAAALDSFGRNDFAAAAAAAQRVACLAPASPTAWRIIAYLQLTAEPAKALLAFARALAAFPSDIETCIDMAAMHAARGEHRIAARALQRGLALAPAAPSLWRNFGAAGPPGFDKCAAYARALAIDPFDANAWRALGAVAADGAMPEGAMRPLRRALALTPSDLEAKIQLGIAHSRVRQWPSTRRFAGRALVISPTTAAGWHNLALADYSEERPTAAERALRRASSLMPDLSHALLTAGILAIDVGDLASARRGFRRARSAAPGFAEAELNLGLLDLLNGCYPAGWRGFSHRWSCQSHRGFRWPATLPRWDGASVKAARLLLRAEPQQALGDTIQFARFIPDAAMRVGEIVLECDVALHRLMTTIPGVARVVPIGTDAGPVDIGCGLMDLGALFAPELAELESSGPYLRSDEDEVMRWRMLLSDLPRPWIGVCWRGNSRFRLDHRRSPGLQRLAPIYLQAGGHLVSLVYDRRPDEPLPDGMADPMPLIADMADTAALVSALDLVITSDTAIAHLAGALGRPTWVLLHEPADWRWLIGRADSPWYPSMRLYRQPRPDDWSEPVAAAAADLSARRMATVSA